MVHEKFPGIIERVKAIVTDSVVIILFIMIITYVFSLFDSVPDKAKMIAFVFVFVLYDPLFTSIFGGTIGHMLLGLRVKRGSDQMKNILFPLAIVRYIVKASLGIISLITVSGNKNGKAIHDYLVGSVVIYAGQVSQKETRME
ncbi:MAG TPA: RDD family protein [Prolixibacteraceae bacterium]|nr:RDD family protein [Prolixibacteraceae bacterium]